MRILVVFILLAFGLVTEGKTQRLNDAKTQSKDSATLCLCDSASYYESQIRKADSLYKNYLPQYNFEEVKAAMEFFDSYQPSAISGQRWRLFGKETDDGNRLIAESRQLTAAKAHYYHAVGLTEKDDIVGACEHYLIALEIMKDDDIIKSLRDTKTQRRKVLKKQRNDEKTLCDSVTLRLCDSNKEDYEKIRFVALIYNRLGRLFYNESFCDLAIIKYRKAISYVKLIKDFSFEANLMKELANSYQLSNNADSALSYYKKSLKTSCNPSNKLDIDKSIAQIMYLNKGERDSAIMMLRSNLNKIHDEKVKYSYHFVLGNIFYHNKNYDSALYYLKENLDDSIINNKIAFTTKLSAIYDSIKDYEMRSYYDNLSSKLFKNNINKEIDKSKIQALYNNYNERKTEKTRMESKTRSRRITIIACLTAFIMVVLIIVYIKYNHRKQSNKLKTVIDDCVNRIDNYSKDIENKNIIISQKEKLISDYQKTNDKKDKIIDKQKKEIDRIKIRISKKNVNIEAYYASDICKKILSRKNNDFSSLKEDELALLLKSADEHLDNISERLRNKFPSLNKNDIYTICLLILNVEKGKLQYLLSKDRKTIWNRLNKIKSLMNVDENHDLFLHIKDNFLN